MLPLYTVIRVTLHCLRLIPNLKYYSWLHDIILSLGLRKTILKYYNFVYDNHLPVSVKFLIKFHIISGDSDNII